MATNGAFKRVEWSSSPVTFHRNKGENVRLTESSTVASRTESFNCALVFTNEPVIAGQMLKVTMTQKEKLAWVGGMVRAHLVCTLLGCMCITVQIFTGSAHPISS